MKMLFTLIQILFGQIPEALFFAVFMILVKKLDKHLLSFTLLMNFEYVLLMNVFPYNIYSHILFFIVTYLLMKILYKEKCQIIDVFTLGIASIILSLLSVLSQLIARPNMIVVMLLNRILLMLFIFVFRNRLHNIQNLYKKLWNRNDKVKKPIKSTTFRAMNLVIFNLMFYVINTLLVCAMIFK